VLCSKYTTDEQRGQGAVGGELERRYAFRSNVRWIKERVPVEDLAREYTDSLREVSEGRLVGLCPLHGETTPSFYVYTDSADPHFHCYGCGEHGDVLDLFMALDGHDYKWTALVGLAQRFGLELPGRPERWHRWNREKAKRRDALTKIRAEHYRRRFFRLYRNDLARIEDPAEREEEARAIWRGLANLAYACALAAEHRDEAS
jgi:DNA primase